MARDTGFPRADVENDFLRARRRQALSRLVHKLIREPDDVNMILPFDEVVDALGYEGERNLGLQTIKLDSIVGTVDSRRDFDRRFRPTSAHVRERWERIALAQRRGQSMPPIDVYRIGTMHFVRDGHHRVSIALATGQTTIDAYVTEVRTTLPAKGINRRSDLVMKSYQRVFFARVPLPPAARANIELTDPWSYAVLGEAVEAWGFATCSTSTRSSTAKIAARRWYAEEHQPVVRLLRDADLLGAGTETEAYLRVARERYRLMRTHEWNDEVISRLQQELGSRSLAGLLASKCPDLRVDRPTQPRGARSFVDLRGRIEPSHHLVSGTTGVGPTRVARQFLQLCVPRARLVVPGRRVK